MKRLKLCTVALTAFSLLLLTSCLGDSSSKQDFYDLPGAARFEGNKVVVETAIGVIYPPNLLATGFSADDCMLISFSYDSEDPANDSSLNNPYSTVTLLTNPFSISRRDVSFYVGDTTTLLPNEKKIIEGDLSHAALYCGYLNGYLFLTSVHSAKKDEVTGWTMYFDRDQEPTKREGKDVNNQTKIYNEYKVYLRATVQTEGTGSTSDIPVMNAYEAKSMIDLLNMKEKGQNNEGYYLNVKYLKSIEDNKDLVWTPTEEPLFMVVPEK